MLQVTCNLLDEDFNNTDLHLENNILVEFQGPGAYNTHSNEARSFIIEAAKTVGVELRSDQLNNLYRHEEPCRLYFPLPPSINASSLHGISLVHNRIVYRTMIPGHVLRKVFLNFVPANILPNGLQKIKDLVAPREK